MLKPQRAWARGLMVAGLMGSVGLFVLSGVRAGDSGEPHAVIVPGFEYQGSASCSGSKCHSADDPAQLSGQMIGDEYNIWGDSDPHSHAYTYLEDDLSKQIAQKLKIADATAASRCLDCHAINAPANQRGEGFIIGDGVGCEACHGPAQAYLNPHAEEGWTAKQRKTIGSDGLLQQFGLVDTTNLVQRAQSCVACHLQIDKEMIDAGHPPLEFELYAYNYYISKKPDAQFATHWEDPTGKSYDARLWATGQAASLEAARVQQRAWKAKGWDSAGVDALVTLYQAGMDVAMKHFGGKTASQLSGADYTAAKCAAAATGLAQHTDKASTKQHRRVLAFGVAALGSAVFDGQQKEAPESFWNAYDKAVYGQGDDFAAAVAKMAQLAADSVH